MNKLLPLILSIGVFGSVMAASPAPQLRGQQQPTQTQSRSSLEGRVAKIERILDSQALLELTMRLETLQREVTELRGKMEELSYNFKQISEQQRSIYVDLDGRLQNLEERVNNFGSQPVITRQQQGGDSGSQGGAQQQASFDPTKARSDYQAAFNLIKARRYDEAMKSLDQFVSQYPQSEYAGNAQYWLGELNYVKRDFKKAATEFDKVVNNFGKSKKVPDAMLKKGFSYYEMGEWDNARQSLNALKERFPDSTAAHLAQKRLQQMKREGH